MGVEWGGRQRCRDPGTEGKSELKREAETERKWIRRDREIARDGDRKTKREGDRLLETARDEDRGKGEAETDKQPVREAEAETE